MSNGTLTHAEILRQPDVWPDTVARVRRHAAAHDYAANAPVLAGAGSSAYAAAAIAAAWPGARSIPTTDLLLEARAHGIPELPDGGLLISISRSGDSPESLGVVEMMQRLRPDVRHLAIVCDAHGQLAQLRNVQVLALDDRANDRSLAVTGSYSNLVLAGLALRHGPILGEHIEAIASRTRAALPVLDATARRLADDGPPRVTVLSPPALHASGREAALKILEMTDGRIVALPETFLGVRHGPMVFLNGDGLVVCLTSNDGHQRRYEEDLLLELRAKKLGRIAAVVSAPLDRTLADETVPANAPELPDALRAPFEIVFPQLVAWHLSVRLGLDPDVSSPRAVINRVVKGVRVHP
jgi:tagatose-6-phosphate ketose/aldose isomerase